MDEDDAAASRAYGGKSFECDVEGTSYRIRLVESERAYDSFYNVIANPMLWFIQHYLWDLSNAPDIRQNEVDAYEQGYVQVNQDLANAVLDEISDMDEVVVMLHDYHLYTAPRAIRKARPDVFLHHFIHIPWTQPDYWRVLPRDIREDIFEGMLANDIVSFHTRHYMRNFLLCCRELFDLDVDEEIGIVRIEDREVWVRSYPCRSARRRSRSPLRNRACTSTSARSCAAGAPADPARRPGRPVEERAARVHGVRPVPRAASRVPRAGHVHRAHGPVASGRAGVRGVPGEDRGSGGRREPPSRDDRRMPIDLKLRENLEEAIAAYKHYDLLVVNAMFDGMNLVAKEGPLVNERHGVSLLSENTGAHEELGEFSLSVRSTSRSRRMRSIAL